MCQVTYLKPGEALLWRQRILLDGVPMAGLIWVRIPTQRSLVFSQEQTREVAQGLKAHVLPRISAPIHDPHSCASVYLPAPKSPARRFSLKK